MTSQLQAVKRGVMPSCEALCPQFSLTGASSNRTVSHEIRQFSPPTLWHLVKCVGFYMEPTSLRAAVSSVSTWQVKPSCEAKSRAKAARTAAICSHTLLGFDDIAKRKKGETKNCWHQTQIFTVRLCALLVFFTLSGSILNTWDWFTLQWHMCVTDGTRAGWFWLQNLIECKILTYSKM